MFSLFFKKIFRITYLIDMVSCKGPEFTDKRLALSSFTLCCWGRSLNLVPPRRELASSWECTGC